MLDLLLPDSRALFFCEALVDNFAGTRFRFAGDGTFGTRFPDESPCYRPAPALLVMSASLVGVAGACALLLLTAEALPWAAAGAAKTFAFFACGADLRQEVEEEELQRLNAAGGITEPDSDSACALRNAI